MGIQNYSEDVLLITLPEQPQRGQEIEIVNKLFNESADFDVMIDFSNVEILTSGSICGLIKLNKTLKEFGRKLVFYDIPSAIKQIFVRTDLFKVFDFADDEFDALQHIQDKNSSMADSNY